jgi:hypothetical protein
VNFDEYLYSKKIDSLSFRQNENELWETWKKEFDLISPVSFTAQKLYLINPIRRKYQLSPDAAPPKIISTEALAGPGTTISNEPDSGETTKPPVSSPKLPAAKPVFRPKPKMS